MSDQQRIDGAARRMTIAALLFFLVCTVFGAGASCKEWLDAHDPNVCPDGTLNCTCRGPNRTGCRDDPGEHGDPCLTMPCLKHDGGVREAGSDAGSDARDAGADQ